MYEYAKVYVEDIVYGADKAYDYFIPPSLRGKICVGQRIIVPFGNANRRQTGIVTELAEECSHEFAKPIAGIVEEYPILNEEGVQLALWMKKRCFCNFFDAVGCLVPLGMRIHLEEFYQVCEDFSFDRYDQQDPITNNLLHVVEHIYQAQGRASLAYLKEQCGEDVVPQLANLERLGIIRKVSIAARELHDKMQKMVSLTSDEEKLHAWKNDDIRLSSQQKKILDLLEREGSASVKELLYMTGLSESVVKGLYKKGLVNMAEEEVFRRPSHPVQENERQAVQLSAEQQNVYRGLASHLNGSAAAALLHGVTGSGKTMVILKLLDDVLAQGKTAIVLIPEISLTPQMISLFCARYGDLVAISHSGLSVGERMDEWKRIRSGLAKIVLGTRSAVFAPLTNLGLIVMDEEQESAYKSENTPRYHARDIAKYRCAGQGALLLMCSATPSVDSYYRACEGIYHLYSLENRFNRMALPEVEMVDMRLETPERADTLISLPLEQALQETLDKGEQAVLLLNRRGYHTTVSCRHCGKTEMCPHCSVALTYHSVNGRMMCHCCGYSAPRPSVCSQCGSDHVISYGNGTQRTQEKLQELFPKARILRMDADTTSAKYAHQKLLDKFARHEYDFLIGTQMVAKGLDFPLVTLSAVLSADSLLFSSDYRANERAFSMLTQVVGRSGRGERGGKALIQTYVPDHEILAYAASQDYRAFYAAEIALRKACAFPPYCDICVLTLQSQLEYEMKRVLPLAEDQLRFVASHRYGDQKMQIFGPFEAPLYKVNGRYRMKFLIKCRENPRVRLFLNEMLYLFGKDKRFKCLNVSVDMNPAKFN